LRKINLFFLKKILKFYKIYFRLRSTEMRIKAKNLRRLAFNIFCAAGACDEEAKIVSEHFVESNLVGHDSHGVIQIPRYIEAINKGGIALNTKFNIVKESPSIVVIDANWGFGQVTALKAMDIAIEKSKKQGIGCASIFNCNDISRLGAYSSRAASQNCIGMITVNDGGANSFVVPWGGRTPLFSTNPISAAIPFGQKYHICVDMATSVIAGGKIKLSLKRKEKIPEGCIINAAGEPSINPEDFFNNPPGALLPIGGLIAGHKGYALSLLIDILSGALSGAGCSGKKTRDNQGIFICAINIAAFTPLTDFFNEVAQLVKRIKASPKAPGVKEILIPGERAWKEKGKRIREGILIEEDTWKKLMHIASHLGVEHSIYE
jgi:uncharacterized oxidoreductase